MGKRKHKRATVTAASPIAARHGFDDGFLGHETTYAVNVNEQTALAVDTFFACVRTIADLGRARHDVRRLAARWLSRLYCWGRLSLRVRAHRNHANHRQAHEAPANNSSDHSHVSAPMEDESRPTGFSSLKSPREACKWRAITLSRCVVTNADEGCV